MNNKIFFLLIIFILIINNLFYGQDTKKDGIEDLISAEREKLYRYNQELFYDDIFNFQPDKYKAAVEKICEIASSFISNPSLKRRNLYNFLIKIIDKLDYDSQAIAIRNLCLIYSYYELTNFDDYCLGKNILLMIKSNDSINDYKEKYLKLKDISVFLTDVARSPIIFNGGNINTIDALIEVFKRHGYKSIFMDFTDYLFRAKNKWRPYHREKLESLM